MDKENSAKGIKVELNNDGDYIDISTADTDLFDRFMMGYLHIIGMAEKLPQKYDAIGRKYRRPCAKKIVEVSRIDVAFSKDAVEIIDGIFGKDTVRKYFRKLYKKVPYFMPGTECFIDFFDHMAPVLEELFGRRVDDSEKKRTRSMNQYTYFGSKISNGNKAVQNKGRRH